MLEWVAQPGIKLTPAQRAFQQLVTGIESVERQLKAITDLLDVYRPLSLKKLQPLQDQRDKFNREMVLFLDEQLLRKGWTANQRKTMREIACQLAETLFGSAFGEEMETLFDRHSDVSLEAFAAEEKAALEFGIEKLFGVDLGRDGGGTRSAAELMREAERLNDEFEEEKAQQAEVRAAKRGGKKSARQIKTEQQAMDAGKMLKDIYRKLTSVLHPDREPDEAERARKTALMSEANKAYESKNLLKLLQLQLQAGRLSSLAAATLADEKLQLINHTLRQQHDDLRLECHQLEMMVRDEFNLSYGRRLDAALLQKALNSAVAAAKADIKFMRQDMATIKSGDAAFKSWLKEQRQLMKEDEQLDFAIEKAMMGVMRWR